MTKEVGNSELLDTWAADGVIVEPTEEKVDNGWDLGEQPPHEYANWVLNVTMKAVNHVLQNGMPLWNSTTTYAANNFVNHNGTIYAAKQANADSEPPNANWQALAPYPPRRSVQLDSGFLQLVGDVDSPGNNKLYGTNGAGVRGWQDAPAQADGFATGDLKWRYGFGALTGYVRLNGLSIGNVDSGATERENADTEALFTYLWETDSALDVSGGRGASAAADWAALKRLTLPDARNRLIAAMDGMGAPNTSRIAGGTAIGAAGGTETKTLASANVPAKSITLPKRRVTSGEITEYDVYSPSNAGLPAGSDSFAVGGSGTAFNIMPPYINLGTIYMKL